MMTPIARPLGVAALLLALAACQAPNREFPVAEGTEAEPTPRELGTTPSAAGVTTALTNPAAPDVTQRASCPETLSFVRAKLVTPPEGFAMMQMSESVERTLTRPVEDMIVGGLDESIENGQRTVRTYKEILANEDKVRAEYKGWGKDDAWIDMYLLTVQDGVTINQAFVDAAECRRSSAFERRITR